jgi:serine phosphatase RsbU (regulator of sigma subunit)
VSDLVVHVENSEDNLRNIEKLFKDYGCEKCLDLETQIQEALKELSSTQL